MIKLTSSTVVLEGFREGKGQDRLEEETEGLWMQLKAVQQLYVVSRNKKKEKKRKINLD